MDISQPNCETYKSSSWVCKPTSGNDVHCSSTYVTLAVGSSTSLQIAVFVPKAEAVRSQCAITNTVNASISAAVLHSSKGVQYTASATDKLPAAKAMLDALGLDWAQAAAIGDDWPDLPVLRRVGFAAAPANAHVAVRAAVKHVTAARGGEGAAREFCDLLLMAGGHYRRLLDAAQGVVA